MSKRGPKVNPNTPFKVSLRNSYPEILSMVKEGFGIKEACDKVGIHRPSLYKNITQEQIVELKAVKVSKAKFINSIYNVLNED